MTTRSLEELIGEMEELRGKDQETRLAWGDALLPDEKQIVDEWILKTFRHYELMLAFTRTVVGAIRHG